jgi:hypothetical protein
MYMIHALNNFVFFTNMGVIVLIIICMFDMCSFEQLKYRLTVT